ncbi:MAG: hypothetical protein HYV13_01790 [Candidatus Doudnabacteria bacterium]|nr:hypothetical protein [Candidatus Doudnabacteria bacterium]
MIPYKKILKQAWLLTKSHKFLWAYGLLLVLSAAVVLFLKSSANLFVQKPASALLILAVLVAVLFLGFRSKVGLVTAFSELLAKRETNLRKSFRTGRKYYERIAIEFLLFAVFLTLISWLLFEPASAAASRMFSTLVYAIVGLSLIAVVELAALFTVFNDLRARQSLSAAWDLVSKYWFSLTFLSLVLLIINSILPTIASIVFFRFYGNIGMALAAAFFLLCSALPLVFTQACWILTFQELVKPVKLEGEQEAALPEAA